MTLLDLAGMDVSDIYGVLSKISKTCSATNRVSLVWKFCTFMFILIARWTKNKNYYCDVILRKKIVQVYRFQSAKSEVLSLWVAARKIMSRRITLCHHVLNVFLYRVSCTRKNVLLKNLRSGWFPFWQKKFIWLCQAGKMWSYRKKRGPQARCTCSFIFYLNVSNM